MAQIFFNGKSYNSLEDLSEKDRQKYQQLADMFVDKNGNGIPDFLEGDIVKNISNIYTAASSIHFDGNTYNNFNELPSDVQSKVKTAFSKMEGMGLVPQGSYEEHANKHTVHNEDYIKSTPFVSREYKPVIEEDKGTNPLLWLLIGAAFALCIGAAIVGFFFL